MVGEYTQTALRAVQVIDRYATGEVRPHLVKLAVRVLQLQQPMVAKQLQAHGWSTAIFKVLACCLYVYHCISHTTDHSCHCVGIAGCLSIVSEMVRET